ncbi:MAG: tol-pal system YbgF family protein [Vicinamibacterales bacterium]
MKRVERHHLKENELANLAASARASFETQRTAILAGVGAVLVLLVGVLGYSAWNNRVESEAQTKLAAALAVEDARVGPPVAFGSQAPTGLSFVSQREKNQALLAKYKEVADAFPSHEAGLFARYREAATHLALGQPKEAEAAFQQVMERGGNGHYGRMARLGLAEAQAQNGEYDAAIATFQELSQQKDGPLPVDGVLLRLGRIYLDAGKRGEAEQAFKRIVDEYPDSLFAPDAKRELDALKMNS